jgi:hypothetical protein
MRSAACTCAPAQRLATLAGAIEMKRTGIELLDNGNAARLSWADGESALIS